MKLLLKTVTEMQGRPIQKCHQHTPFQITERHEGLNGDFFVPELLLIYAQSCCNTNQNNSCSNAAEANETEN